MSCKETFTLLCDSSQQTENLDDKVLSAVLQFDQYSQLLHETIDVVQLS